jgi:hypothetical protein
VDEQLQTIRETKSGTALLQSLRDHDGHVLITPTSDANGGTDATDYLSSLPKGTVVTSRDGKYTFTGTGQGSDSVVAFNPDYRQANPLAPGSPKPADAVLFHELAHASDAAQGNNLVNTPDPRFDNGEEWQAIQSENKYLAERGYPYMRTDHASGFAPNPSALVPSVPPLPAGLK